MQAEEVLRGEEFFALLFPDDSERGVFETFSRLGEGEELFSPYSHLQSILKKSKELFMMKEYGEAAKKLAASIGLGLGLTPTGDDFLCGVLASCVFLDRKEHVFSLALRREIAENMEKTNDISRSFFRAALEGQFMEIVKDIGRFDSASAMRRAFEAIGHSSGMDTLSGIYYGMALFSK